MYKKDPLFTYCYFGLKNNCFKKECAIYVNARIAYGFPRNAQL